MSRTRQPPEELRRATAGFLAKGHAHGPDEDLHPFRLDPAERDLERALARFEEWKEKEMGRARGRP